MAPCGVPVAGFGLRLLGALVDWFIVLALTIAAGWPFVLRIYRALEQMMAWTLEHRGQMLNPSDFDYVAPLTSLFMIRIGVQLVLNLLTLRAWSATIGQRVVGIRVVGAESSDLAGLGLRPVLLRSIAWALLSLADQVVLVATLLSCLGVLWNRRGQALHDRMSGTMVVQTTRVEHPAATPR